MLNAAIIGLGWWGKTITERMQVSTEMRIARAVDLYPENQGEYTAKYGVPVTADYAEVLADPKIDAVILTTPNSLHTRQIAQAAQAGKHVFCEKPLALNVVEARQSVQLCKEKASFLAWAMSGDLNWPCLRLNVWFAPASWAKSCMPKATSAMTS